MEDYPSLVIMWPDQRRRTTSQAGMALSWVLAVLMIISTAAVSFIWFMNQQQTRAGARYRSSAALAAAEAGVYRALSILESVSTDGSLGRAWQPSEYTEDLQIGPLQGRFTLSLSGGTDELVIISAGEVSGVSRRLRARVYLASPAFMAALHVKSSVNLEAPPAATIILPYVADRTDRRWFHIAAGRAIWFASADASLNDDAVTFEAAPGPVDAPRNAGSPGMLRAGPVRLLLARDADLMLGASQQRIDAQQGRLMGVSVAGEVLRTDTFPRLPHVDRAFYRSRAAANTSNADLNAAAGQYAGDAELARKRDSVYSAAQAAQLLAYLKTGLRRPRLEGVVYIRGGVAIEGQRLEIAEGALVTEGTLHLVQAAALEVIHSATTRTLPGILVLDNGALVVTHKARLRVHGLIYTGRVIDFGSEAHVDVVGAMASNDRDLGFRNSASKVLIRYDPAVLGTPGLRPDDSDPVIAWVAAWEELP